MGHDRNGTPHATSALAGLDDAGAASVAATLQGLATPSRLLLVSALTTGPRTVSELTAAVGMEQSAVSHQLRHLRELGFVTVEREGRAMVYRLFDHHVVDIVDQAMAHAEHVRLGRDDQPGSQQGRRPT